MYRSNKDMLGQFFPTLDISLETWTVIYDKYEISTYGRLRTIKTGKLMNPSDGGVYSIIYKFSPKYIKISDYVVEQVEVEVEDEVIIDPIPVSIEQVEITTPIKKKKKKKKKV